MRPGTPLHNLTSAGALAGLLACTPLPSDRVLLDPDGDGFPYNVDCDETDPTVHPGAEERCGGGDEDCDGEVDEPDAAGARAWYTDADGDGLPGTELHPRTCTQPEGSSDRAWDCDDHQPAVWPDAPEVCGDGLVNDCQRRSEADALQDCGVSGLLGLEDAERMFYGYRSESSTGFAVDRLGDLDGDGRIELVITAPTSTNGDMQDAGQVFVMTSTKLAQVGTSSRVSLGYSPFFLEGAQDGMLLGHSVAAAGDVDGDGLEDLLVGAPGAATSGGVWGAALLFSSQDRYWEGVSGSTDARVTLEGSAFAPQLGWGVAAAGDVDGDGLADILVSAPTATPDGISEAGAVLLLLGGGALGQAAWLTPDDADLTLTGSRQRGRFGLAADGAGDLDDDGLGDLLVGGVRYTGGVEEQGRALVFLATDLMAASGRVGEAEAHLRLDGVSAGDAVGSAVAGVGDVDGEGRPDLLIGGFGASGPEATEQEVGLAWLVLGEGELVQGGGLGDMGQADLTLVGASPYDEAGRMVAGVGDFDADGLPDVLVGAPAADREAYNAGTSYLLLSSGALRGRGLLYLEHADAELVGDDEGAGVGSAAAGGDVNGDGVDDLLVSAIRDTTLGSERGAVYVFPGGGY